VFGVWHNFSMPSIMADKPRGFLFKLKYCIASKAEKIYTTNCTSVAAATGVSDSRALQSWECFSQCCLRRL